MIGNKKVSCIIPAYNEGPRIGGVLDVATKCSLLDELFVVDNASSDDTYEVASRYKNVKVIRHNKNLGKAASVFSGLSASTGDLIMLIDADLEGLTIENLENLLSPHAKIECMTMSLRGNVPAEYRWMGIAIWTGERALPRYILEKLSECVDAEYAIESLINQMVIRHKLPIISVNWPNVRNVVKMQKEGVKRGLINEIKMRIGIFQHTSVIEYIFQAFWMPIINITSKLKLK